MGLQDGLPAKLAGRFCFVRAGFCMKGEQNRKINLKKEQIRYIMLSVFNLSHIV